MRGLFTNVLVVLLGVSGLMSPAVTAGDDIQCDPVEIAQLLASDGQGQDYFGYTTAISGTMALVGAQFGEDTNGIKSGAVYVFEQQENGSWSEAAKLTASDGSNFDYFGGSVAILGTTALIGAYGNESRSGSAYIFEQQQDGSWLETAKLRASDGASSDYFGYSVAISGTTAVIGAYRDDDNGSTSGSAYIFEQQQDGSWLETAKLRASDGASSDYFGYSVATSGTTALIGAYGDDDNGINSGSGYIFEQQQDGSWLETAKLSSSDGDAADYFGKSVAISGSTALIGSDGDDGNGDISGSAYIFEQQQDGSWSEAAKLTASDGSNFDYFGGSVAISGTTAVVGADGDNDDSNGIKYDSGSVYIFNQQKDGNWLQTTKLTSSDGDASDYFGTSVAISGSSILSGARGDSDSSASSGSAYTFRNTTDDTWIETTKLLTADGSNGDEFGISVAISDDIALIGAHLDDGNGIDSGSAYIFMRSADGKWIEIQEILASDGEAYDSFGLSVAISDTTALIGASGDNDNGEASGSAYVYERQLDGTWIETDKLMASDGSIEGAFGRSVAISNNTILVGARGSVYIFEKQMNGTWLESAKILSPESDLYGSFGNAVSISGINVIIGASNGFGNGFDLNNAYIFEQQSDASWLEVARLQPADTSKYGAFGYAVSISGTTALVGDPRGLSSNNGSGSAYVFEQMADGTWIEAGELLASDGEDRDEFGYSTALLGTTALVGARGDNDNGYWSGSCYLYEKQTDGKWLEVSKLLPLDSSSSKFFGNSVALSSSTMLIGARRGYSENGPRSGSAYLFGVTNIIDCNDNGICDLDDVANGTSQDCNSNGIPDECDTTDGVSNDCNSNGFPDECEFFADCNSNGVLDQCDIADGTSDDLNGNGIPDECLVCEFQSTIEFNNYGPSNGLDIAIDGNIAAIVCNTNGSTDDDLEVQFFKLNGTSWLHEATLPLPQARNAYYPRKAIAISGDYVIAGFADAFDPDPVAIYHRNNGDWIQQASLQPPASSQYFALSVDISGDTAVVGSPTDSGGQALVYRRAADYWYLEATLIEPGEQESGFFASEVAIDGDTLLVGSIGEGGWAFERSDNTWSFVERIQSQTDDEIGCSIDLDGDVAVMGSRHNSSERTVVVFRRDSDGHWMEEQELTTMIPESPPLGRVVRISGDTVLTNSGFDFTASGARDSEREVFLAEATNSIRGDDDGLNSPGNAHLFRYEDGLWRETKRLSRPELPDSFINSPHIALSGERALVAFTDDGGQFSSEITWFTTTTSNDESEIDCNDNQICDAIDLILGTSRDCDGNGTLDDCDIESGVYVDVDLDGIPDVCEPDCNGNLIPDDSELEQGLELDCNSNGVPDSCDISNGLSPDGDGDGIPDECDTNYIINVSVDGSGLFTDLQDAMDLVLPGGTIQVTAGMYGPISLPPYSVTLVSIDGAQSTFIEGGIGQSAVTIAEGDHDDTVVDGFTLMNGQAVGGGLLISDSNPTIRNCIFTMNESLIIGGGGLVLSGAPVFESCQFVSNSAILGGGGLAIVGTAIDGGPCVIDDCLFEANSVTYKGTGATDSARGGGLFASEANVDILDSQFLLNSAPDLGGGLDLNSSTSMLVSDTIFAGNDTGFRGRSISSFYNTPGPELELSGNSLCQNDGNGATSYYIFGNWTDLGDNLFGSDCDADGVCDFDQPDEDCNGNGVLDSCDIAYGSAEDCNGNGIPDWCDINVYETSVDFNQNGVPDDCKPDCNGNNVPDYLDISFGNSLDCDGNGIPDECEDCNNNGIGDNCDIADGTSEDLNANGIPDECDIDCDGDGVPDDYEIDEGTEQDCNNNGIPDWCDINVFGTSFDCNGNAVPDSCDIEFGDSGDCNSNGTPDECDIAAGISQDCDANGVPDDCDIADGTALDCNDNGTPDTCESDYIDCNNNGVRDDCDIEDGASGDCNENGIPDECDFIQGILKDCDENNLYDQCEEGYSDCQPNGIADFCDIANGTSNDVNFNGLPDDCEPDCNENGFPDFIDIAFGNSQDENNNGVPDECDCPDINQDGFIDVNDLLIVIEQFGVDCSNNDCTADIGGPDGEPDGLVNVNDVLLIIQEWGCENKL